MNKDTIKKLVKMTFTSGGAINQTIANFVISKLSRSQLVYYLRSLKNFIYRDSIRIISSENLSSQLKKDIQEKFKGKTVFFEENKNQSDGIKVIIGDSYTDLTFGGYTNRLFDQIKI